MHRYFCGSFLPFYPAVFRQNGAVATSIRVANHRKRHHMQPKIFKHFRTCSIVLASLLCAASSAAAQNRADADSVLTQSAGQWTASGVSVQSGPFTVDSSHAFTVDIQRQGDQLQITLPADLKLGTGRVYLLARTATGIFRYADGSGRIMEFTLTEPNRASLLITSAGGDGRITWQLTRAR